MKHKVLLLGLFLMILGFAHSQMDIIVLGMTQSNIF